MIPGPAKIRDALYRSLEVVVMVLMAVLAVDVVWQVVTRMASSIPRDIIAVNPSRWTDELAVLLMIWVALLGASVGFVKKSHLGVDYFVGKLPEKMRSVTEIIVFVLIGVFAATCMIYGGILFVSDNVKQLSPALNIPMSSVYAAVPISGFFFLLVSIESIYERVSSFGAGGEESESKSGE